MYTIYIHVCVLVCVFVSVCLCIHIYIYRGADAIPQASQQVLKLLVHEALRYWCMRP